MVAYVTAEVYVQHFSNKTGPNILVYPLTIKSIVKDSTSESSDAIVRVVYHDLRDTLESTCFDDKRVCRYCNRRYYCWEDNSLLRRNCASHSIPAIQYSTHTFITEVLHLGS